MNRLETGFASGFVRTLDEWTRNYCQWGNQQIHIIEMGEKTVLEFLNGKKDRTPEFIKLKLWFDREVFFTLRRNQERV